MILTTLSDYVQDTREGKGRIDSKVFLKTKIRVFLENILVSNPRG
jgi:hypothetical protein